MPTHDNLCPQCGKPTALVFGNPRKDGLCAQCAAKKRQEQKALENSSPKKVETVKADETIEANKAKPAKRNGNEKPVPKTHPHHGHEGQKGDPDRGHPRVFRTCSRQ